MRIKTRAALLLALVTTVLLSGQFNSREPSYDNKSLTAWLNDLNSIEPEIWHRAETAVRMIGSNALPVLAERLQARDSSSRLRLIEFFDRYPVVELESAADYHDAALEACRILGATAAPLVPDIIPFLDGNYRTHAVKVLAAIGGSAVQPLIRALDHEPARAGASTALGTIAQRGHLAVAALVPHLTDGNPETRTAVAWAMGRFGAQAEAALADLSSLTNDPVFSVREQARVAVSRIRQAAGFSRSIVTGGPKL